MPFWNPDRPCPIKMILGSTITLQGKKERGPDRGAYLRLCGVPRASRKCTWIGCCCPWRFPCVLPVFQKSGSTVKAGGWMHWGAYLRSSGVPRASRKYTLTGSCCPWRCARSSACSRMATSSGSSTNTTLLAAVKSKPTPAGDRAAWRGVSYYRMPFHAEL